MECSERQIVMRLHIEKQCIIPRVMFWALTCQLGKVQACHVTEGDTEYDVERNTHLVGFALLF